ncbi:MAG: 30S ribosomal protein S5 [Halobacteriovorax sp.]|nr:30S ribosomal protein S5 [Halobacteriovorax sp.]|tara:strand:- start:149 stop:751 length:603 start_codon:yes stop_codon:yes gene_type:complete
MSDEVKTEETTVEEGAKTERAPRGKGKRDQAPRKKVQTVESEFEERVVAVNRVAKVVKGGRRFSFSALMIVGDKKGRVGYGLGKAKEVPEAIRKATQAAHKNMINVPLEHGTIPHKTIGEFDAGKLLFMPAADGTGVKAAGACRSILELAGVRNCMTKSLRGNNPHNIVKATFMALTSLRSVEQVAAARGKDPKGLRLKQ